jgi:hypothetical protein
VSEPARLARRRAAAETRQPREDSADHRYLQTGQVVAVKRMNLTTKTEADFHGLPWVASSQGEQKNENAPIDVIAEAGEAGDEIEPP